MTHRRVAVVFTGGTISMLVDPVAGGNVPVLDGKAILARTPGLEQIAEVVAVDKGLVPASHFTFAKLFDLSRVLGDLAADPQIDGIVFVQGTDTIEETSFFFDLLHAAQTPIVVTGAMRSAADPDYDGPRNLRDAVRVAAAPALAGRGVVVVLNGTIEAADDVTKTHATSVATFQSLNRGSLGRVEEARVILTPQNGARRRPLATELAAEPIPIVTATVAMDASILEAAVGLRPAGIVVEATGAGNTSREMLDMASRAIAADIPVVLATRCPSGGASGIYAFPGGGATWLRAGALLAGTLTGPKARIALALGLGAGLRGPELAEHLRGRGE